MDTPETHPGSPLVATLWCETCEDLWQSVGHVEYIRRKHHRGFKTKYTLLTPFCPKCHNPAANIQYRMTREGA